MFGEASLVTSSKRLGKHKDKRDFKQKYNMTLPLRKPKHMRKYKLLQRKKMALDQQEILRPKKTLHPGVKAKQRIKPQVASEFNNQTIRVSAGDYQELDRNGGNKIEFSKGSDIPISCKSKNGHSSCKFVSPKGKVHSFHALEEYKYGRIEKLKVVSDWIFFRA